MRHVGAEPAFSGPRSLSLGVQRRRASAGDAARRTTCKSNFVYWTESSGQRSRFAPSSLSCLSAEARRAEAPFHSPGGRKLHKHASVPDRSCAALPSASSATVRGGALPSAARDQDPRPATARRAGRKPKRALNAAGVLPGSCGKAEGIRASPLRRKEQRRAGFPSHPTRQPPARRRYLPRPEREPGPRTPGLASPRCRGRPPARRERDTVPAGPLRPQPAGRCSSRRGGGERRAATRAAAGAVPGRPAGRKLRGAGRHHRPKASKQTAEKALPPLTPAPGKGRQHLRPPRRWGEPRETPLRHRPRRGRRGATGPRGTTGGRGALQASGQQALIHCCNGRIRTRPGSKELSRGTTCGLPQWLLGQSHQHWLRCGRTD